MSKVLTAMGKLKMDFGLTVDDVLDLSDRDGVLLALHLFQVKPEKSREEEWLENVARTRGIENSGLKLCSNSVSVQVRRTKGVSACNSHATHIAFACGTGSSLVDASYCFVLRPPRAFRRVNR